MEEQKTQEEIKKEVLKVLEKGTHFIMIVPAKRGIRLIKNCNKAFEMDVKFMLKVEDILNT